MARRYVNQNRDFIAKESRTEPGADFEPTSACGDDLEGVLHLRPESAVLKGKGAEVAVFAQLLRCSDGQEILGRAGRRELGQRGCRSSTRRGPVRLRARGRGRPLGGPVLPAPQGCPATPFPTPASATRTSSRRSSWASSARSDRSIESPCAPAPRRTSPAAVTAASCRTELCLCAHVPEVRPRTHAPHRPPRQRGLEGEQHRAPDRPQRAGQRGDPLRRSRSRAGVAAPPPRGLLAALSRRRAATSGSPAAEVPGRRRRKLEPGPADGAASPRPPRLPRLALAPPAEPVERLRTPPHPEGMSTLEAVAFALAQLEGPEIAQPLLALHARAVDQGLRARGR